MTPNVITIAVSASAWGSGSLKSAGSPLPTSGGRAGRPDDDQQHVGAVAEQAEADDDAAELALQHEVGADRRRARRRRQASSDAHGVTLRRSLDGLGRSVVGSAGRAAGSGSSPNASNTMSTRPTTTRYTPMSNSRVVVRWTSPEQRQVDRAVARRRARGSPSSSGASGGARRRASRPVPRIVHGRKRVIGAPRRCRRRRSAGRSPRRRPGRRRSRRRAGCGRRRAGSTEPTRTTWKIVAHRDVDDDEALHGVTSLELARRRRAVARGAGRALADVAGTSTGTGQGDRADGRRGEHGDLAEGVEAAEVDEDHVDDVAAVAVGHGPLHHLVGHRRGRCAAVAGDQAKAKTTRRRPWRRPRRARHGRPACGRRSKRSGRRRSTSTKRTVERVSIATWVSARSGAPWTTNRPAMA